MHQNYSVQFLNQCIKSHCGLQLTTEFSVLDEFHYNLYFITISVQLLDFVDILRTL